MTIDDTLDRLSASPAHPGLDAIDAGVFARIEADGRARRHARRGMIAAVGAAGIAGMAGAAIPAGPRAAAPLAFAPVALAPSTLLVGGGDGE